MSYEKQNSETINEYYKIIKRFLEFEFGRIATNNIDKEELLIILENFALRIAQNVKHHHVEIEFKRAQESSANMLNAALAMAKVCKDDKKA